MPHRDRFSIVRGEAGMALPLALIGLFLVSILIVGTLITSSSESALSYAHQDATQSLYSAAGALEAYVAQENMALAPVANWSFTPPGSTEAVLITVSRASSMPTPFGINRETFSIHAVPTSGGRAVAAMVQIGPFEMGIESAATFAGDASIGGSTVVSDGRDAQFCDLEAGQNAVVHGAGTDVDTVGNQVEIKGGVEESDLTGEELIRRTLGGYSIQELASFIQAQNLEPYQISRFGTNPIWGSALSFGGNTKIRSWDRVQSTDVVRNPNNLYNWYCPGEMDRPPPPGNRTACPDVPGIDTETYRIILVDAANSEITIEGDHGQGLLLVINGGIAIRGGFIFRGLVVSTNDIDISGTGNKIEGAVVSQNLLRVDRDPDTPSDFRGNAVVRFNRCALNAVTNAITGGGGTRVLSRTFGWTELVR